MLGLCIAAAGRQAVCSAAVPLMVCMPPAAWRTAGTVAAFAAPLAVAAESAAASLSLPRTLCGRRTT